MSGWDAEMLGFLLETQDKYKYKSGRNEVLDKHWDNQPEEKA